MKTKTMEFIGRMKEQTIGCEIEMAEITRNQAIKVVAKHFGTESTVRRLNDYYDSWACEDNKGRKWKVSKDVSIKASSELKKAELITPILKYEDMEDLQQIVRDLRKAKAISNPDHGSGVHIHIGANGHDARTLRNLANIMASHEDLLIGALNLDRYRINRYCRPVDPDFLKRINKKKPTTMQELSDIWYIGNSYDRNAHYNNSRYHMLNYHATFTKGTIEFRLFQFDNPECEKKGGLHAGQLKAYIQLCLALSQMAKEAKGASSKPQQNENRKYAMRTWLLRLGITSFLSEIQNKLKKAEDRDIYDNSVYGIEKKQFPYMLCITNMLLHDLNTPKIYHSNTLLKDVLDYTEKDKFDIILMNPPYGGSEKNDVKSHFPSDLASSETADLFMSVIMYRLKKKGRAAVILPDGFLFGLDNAKVNIKKKLFNEFNLHTIIRMPGSVFAPYTSITTNILFFDNTGATKETWFYRLDMPEGIKHFSKTKPMLLSHFEPCMEWWKDRKEIEIDGNFKSKLYTKKEIEDLNYNIDLCGFPHVEEEILDPDTLIKNYEKERAEINKEIDGILKEIKKQLTIKKGSSF